MLDKIYKIGSKGIAVKFIQECLNNDLSDDVVINLVVDGVFGAKTETAVKAYQKAYNLTVDGMVGAKTFKVMIFDNPNLFDELIYDLAVGG
jgi:peptidoglycan hydrolase-like protein with peptidoglycan-binding domain